MSAKLIHPLLVVLLGCMPAACVMEAFDSDSSASQGEGDDVGDDGDDDDFDRDDCKIEGAQIGVVGLELPLGDVTVVFDSWIAKPGEPDEYMGFTFHTTGRDVGYVVKAGGETFHSTDTSWLHPDGIEGPVSAISNVDYCEECEEPGSCDPGDPGDDPDCNDPDGCDPGDPGDPEDPDCNDPDGCDPGDPGDPEDPGECEVDADCPTGEFCEGGTCLPIVQ